VTAETHGRCPLCGGAAVHAFTTTDRNRRLGDERFHYNRCTRCGVLFLANVPDDLGRFYPPDYYAAPHELERAARDEAYKLDLIRTHVRPGALVEIGPGAGAFAYGARLAGYDVTAVEMDAAACEHLRSVVGVDAIQSDAPHEALARLAPSRVVAMWHVLEHLQDPWACLEAAARNVEPGGVVALAMPNPGSAQFRVMRARWPHVDAPRHLFLIPPKLLRDRALGLGLELAALTVRDPGTLYWNRFGWQYMLMRPRPRRVRLGLALMFGFVVSTLMAPIERTDLRGSTYTAVLRKPVAN
jgi:SAM-dependent methyltransferase